RTTAFYFFFVGPANSIFYTLSLHDALPIWCPASVSSANRAGRFHSVGRPVCPPDRERRARMQRSSRRVGGSRHPRAALADAANRSEEHTSELQSRGHLVCRLLLEKKKNNKD